MLMLVIMSVLMILFFAMYMDILGLLMKTWFSVTHSTWRKLVGGNAESVGR